MTAPLIILGMHRSGTSMLSRILRHQGVFLGHRVQDDDEALFFLELNRWMLRLSGTEWDHPLPAIEVLEDTANIDRLADVLRGRMQGWRTRRFLGPHFFAARGRISADLPFHWGFKDPRSALFLPVWLRLFPEAKLLRIRRHGIDVAASLRARHRQIREMLVGQYQLGARLGVTMPARIRTVDTVRCRTIEGALGIWAEYEAAMDRWLADVPAAQQMTIRYEDYLADPAGHHGAISPFVGLSLSSPLPGDISPDQGRAFAYRRDAELAPEAQRLAPVLAARGYEP